MKALTSVEPGIALVEDLVEDRFHGLVEPLDTLLPVREDSPLAHRSSITRMTTRRFVIDESRGGCGRISLTLACSVALDGPSIRLAQALQHPPRCHPSNGAW